MATVRDGNSAKLKGVKKSKGSLKNRLKPKAQNGKQSPSPAVAKLPTQEQCFHAIAVNTKVMAEQLGEITKLLKESTDG
jgi:hypothetical protein